MGHHPEQLSHGVDDLAPPPLAVSVHEFGPPAARRLPLPVSLPLHIINIFLYSHYLGKYVAGPLHLPASGVGTFRCRRAPGRAPPPGRGRGSAPRVLRRNED